MRWFDPQTFHWDDAPLSSFQSVATASFTYVLLVVLSTVCSRAFLPTTDKKEEREATLANDANRKERSMAALQWRPWFGSDLKPVQFVHNVILVVGSATMFGGVTLEAISRHKREIAASTSSVASTYHWPVFLFCETTDSGTASGPLYYWSYIFYLSKYYELLDTALQLARGKPPPHFVLHVYHHAVVLFMTWAWCEYKQSLQFIGLAFNTAVHVVMYTYFLQRTITRKTPRWKSFVTSFQILQFAFSVLCFGPTLYMFFVKKSKCSGMAALAFNAIFNITLLHSFVGVLLTGRKNKQKSKKV